METKERLQYINDWKRKSVYRVMLQFNLKKDKEIVEALESCDNKNDLIRKALNAYINK